MENIVKDFVVIGGGMAGTCAAIAAARNGLKVALVHERPVLGGNASSEIRVWCCGAIGGGNNLAEETGIICEMKLENLYKNFEGNPLFWDTILLDFVHREKNIELFLNTTVNKVAMQDPTTIKYCSGWQMGSERELVFYAPVFADCTGDGTVGFLAGAQYRMGREGKGEFGESLAPDTKDNYTLGSSIFFYTKKSDKKVTYIKPDFAYDWKKVKEILSIGNRTVSEHYSGCDYWWFEFGGILDTIHDNEKIKEELQKIVYGIWDYIKNSGEFDADYLTLEWISYIPGKRESRRLMGDYILTQHDIETQRIFEDAVCYGGWSMDLHPSEGIYSKEEPCRQIRAGVYTIPFRSLYSKNISNLMFAGRNISTSHVAYSSTRVMNTTSLMGHAIGTAAYFCKKYNVVPREIYRNGKYLSEYQSQLLKEDCYIIGMKNEDERDFARNASITASSVRKFENTVSCASVKLDKGMYILFPCDKRVDILSLKLNISDDTELSLSLYEAEKPQNFKPERFIKDISIKLSKGQDFWLDIPLEHAFTGYLTVHLHSNPFVRLHTSKESFTGVFCYENEFIRPFLNPCFKISPSCSVYSCENIKNGYNRPYLLPNLWISDKLAEGSPQFIELDFSKEIVVNEVILFFNPDLNIQKNNLRPALYLPANSVMPDELVKEYRLIGYNKNGNEVLVHKKNNYSRYARHHIGNKKINRLRVEVIDTWGNPYAEIYEIRVY